jgi:hypothetical protein
MAKLFDDLLGNRGESTYEMPFRPRPEHELRVAHVASITTERYLTINDDDNLHGSP